LTTAVACGDSGETGPEPESDEPRWACVRSSPTYCTCVVVEGTLALSSGQQEVDGCAVTDISGGMGICWQADDNCSCISYECGADLDLGTCGCFADHHTIDTSGFAVSTCDDYASCCVSADSELCFCGTLPCEAGEVEVTSCNAQTAGPVLDERDPARASVAACAPPADL
jgi:hypothetical protein